MNSKFGKRQTVRNIHFEKRFRNQNHARASNVRQPGAYQMENNHTTGNAAGLKHGTSAYKAPWVRGSFGLMAMLTMVKNCWFLNTFTLNRCWQNSQNKWIGYLQMQFSIIFRRFRTFFSTDGAASNFVFVLFMA